MRITQKIGLLVAIPLVAAVAFAGLAASITGGQAAQAENLRGLVDTGGAAGVLAANLSSERAAAVGALAVDSDEIASSYADRISATDKAIRVYRAKRSNLDVDTLATNRMLDRIDTQLGRLDKTRGSVRSADRTASSIAFVYRIIIANLLSYREAVPQVGEAPAEVADQLRAASALSQATEFVGLQEVAVLRAGVGEILTSVDRQEISATRIGYTDAMLDFDRLASSDWRSEVEQTQINENVVESRKLESDVARIKDGEALKIDPQQWSKLMTARADALAKVGRTVDGQNSRDVAELRDGQRWLTGIQIFAVVAAVAAAVIVAVWLSRPVVRGLRRLRDAARVVAKKELPEAVARLDNHEILGELTPEQFADAMEPPVQVIGNDELAEVGTAFNDVHREAVRVAAQQALLRLHIGAIFVNLARRGHALAGRLTSEIDEAESRELDPERLERLFTLDHLVTLLGRSNDSLLVLGGTSPAKVRVSDEPLGDVLTAAQSQIEQYTRIRLTSIDTGLAVRAAVVDDVVKLLAELMDNAARYSQPDVSVEARALADRLVIQISDDGIGIESSQLDVINSRLVSKAPLDLEAVRSMGLTVVGHIASRLGISVQLRVGSPRGTVAEIMMPAALLTAAVSGAEAQTLAAAKQRSRDKPDRRPTPPLFQDAPPVVAQATEPEVASEPVMVPVVHFDRAALMESTREHPAVPKPRGPFEDGWQAAEEAARPVSPAGDGALPRRTPGTRLVPGGEVPDTIQGAAEQDHRDPAAIGAMYSAYARGRSSSGVSPLNSPNGSRSAS